MKLSAFALSCLTLTESRFSCSVGFEIRETVVRICFVILNANRIAVFLFRGLCFVMLNANLFEVFLFHGL